MTHDEGARRSIADLWSRNGEAGASMVEYGLVVAFLALVAASGANILGRSVATAFDSAAQSLSGIEADEPAEDAEEPADPEPETGAVDAAAAAVKQPKAPKAAKGPSGKSAAAPGQLKDEKDP